MDSASREIRVWHDYFVAAACTGSEEPPAMGPCASTAAESSAMAIAASVHFIFVSNV